MLRPLHSNPDTPLLLSLLAVCVALCWYGASGEVNVQVSVDTAGDTNGNLNAKASVLDVAFGRLRTWLEANGAEVHKHLRFQYKDETVGSGGFAFGGVIKKGDVLVRVPPSLYVSAQGIIARAKKEGPERASRLVELRKEVLKGLGNNEDQTRRVTLVALGYSEFINPDSFWRPYFDVFPAVGKGTIYHKFDKNTRERLRTLLGSEPFNESLSIQLPGVFQRIAQFERVFEEILPKFPDLFPADRISMDTFLNWAYYTLSRVNRMKDVGDSPLEQFLAPGLDSVNHSDYGLGIASDIQKGTSTISSSEDIQPGDQAFYSYLETVHPLTALTFGFFIPANESLWEMELHFGHDGVNTPFLRLDKYSSKQGVLESAKFQASMNLGMHPAPALKNKSFARYLAFLAAKASTSEEKLAKVLTGKKKKKADVAAREALRFAQAWSDAVQTRLLQPSVVSFLKSDYLRDVVGANLLRLLEWEARVSRTWVSDLEAMLLKKDKSDN